MFTFNKKETKNLAKNSGLIKNNVLKKAVLQLDSENRMGAAGPVVIGYSEVVYDRIIHERTIKTFF
ncbi:MULTISPECIES: hypothetical protein [Chryseobacterium]|uniref:Uncharacterized protein n=2 Tax=Chryseobacterium TaxID=59732 RepID=A0A3D9AYE9_9FLAO|nr:MULTISPECIES: hypothetical protein [Chryseobacterium]MDN4012205.1 hypothetical protein [Chryseobacterium gambrini]MDN4031425.1 hypothetical protein [Chryseobacterium gambrini]QWA36921.1 hypothetical protein KKI44_13335 [Chryseobacterium sp. ZHDP1]REC46361.1 hypothetical protein DRF68_14710 [Candidatus Chryseobacterium massiliae]WBV51154.1 hypothetical protein PFY09_12505 [Chryseobacterium gambrini]